MFRTISEPTTIEPDRHSGTPFSLPYALGWSLVVGLAATATSWFLTMCYSAAQFALNSSWPDRAVASIFGCVAILLLLLVPVLFAALLIAGTRYGHSAHKTREFRTTVRIVGWGWVIPSIAAAAFASMTMLRHDDVTRTWISSYNDLAYRAGHIEGVGDPELLPDHLRREYKELEAGRPVRPWPSGRTLRGPSAPRGTPERWGYRDADPRRPPRSITPPDVQWR